MKKLDFNCFCGNWPFNKVRYNTFKKLSELHSRLGIEGGFVSSCEAIFYQDPYEAEKDLAASIKGTNYMQAQIINPKLPGWKDDLNRGVNELSIKAVRLMPGFHDYLLTDDIMDELIEALREYKLPMIITLRMKDERSTWMIHPRTIELSELCSFLEKTEDIITIVANIRTAQTTALHDQFNKRFNLFVDTSGLKDGKFPIESIWQSPTREHLIYGSLAPILEPHSTALLVDAADIGSDAKETIYSGNGIMELLEM